ncbi:MAG: DUF6057 family protein [Mangrovibacterium sp.]|nr:DUF6057 family protein [Mangrovibacterium sp.]
MTNFKRHFSSKILPVLFFTAYFIYWAVINRYLFAFQEQIQLFRFDRDYFSGFLTKPGGLTEYLGAFFTQFYVYPKTGALIVTTAGVTVYLLTRYICRKYELTGVFWPYVPPLLLVILQNDYMFSVGYPLGLILSLTFAAIYVSLKTDHIRYGYGFVGFVLLYLATGGLSLIVPLTGIVHELLFAKSRYRIAGISGFILVSFLLPVLACRTIYHIPAGEAWLGPAIVHSGTRTKYALLLFGAFFAFLIVVAKAMRTKFPEKNGRFVRKREALLEVSVIVLIFGWGVTEYAKDSKVRLFFEMDHHVQSGHWDKVVELSSKNPEANRIILYYTNLALYQTGHLNDRLFCFSQIGTSGLWLDRDEDDFSLFLGGGFFYHLGYLNEAIRWAYDAMVSFGHAPRLLKQLVLTALVNGNQAVAEKYLGILDHTLFYRKWAGYYRNLSRDPDLLRKDPEIAEKRHFLIRNDFVTGTNEADRSLSQLLENHPDNRMAFEYDMSFLLLDKDLAPFAASIHRVKDFGYPALPVHFEEALLLYMGYVKKNLLPPGYGIRKSTVQRFKDYAKAYASRSGTPASEAESFRESFGNTYWFYFHFIDNRASTNEAIHPFN